MNTIEIETITNTLQQKQSWVRKRLQDFLQVWQELTENELKERKLERLKLHDLNCDPDDGQIYETYYLRRGDQNILHVWDEHYERNHFELAGRIDLDECDMDFVRKAIFEIHRKLPEYFKKVQTYTNVNSESGQKIHLIIKALS